MQWIGILLPLHFKACFDFRLSWPGFVSVSVFFADDALLFRRPGNIQDAFLNTAPCAMP
jgi:hypothetical protein